MKKVEDMKNVMNGTYFKGEESYNFNFATDLSMYDKSVFVRTVVDTIVDGHAYDSIIKDMIFDFAIVMLFTDVDTSFTKVLDDNGEEIPALIPIEQFLEENNIVDIVKINMKDGLLEELNKAIDLDVRYRTGIHSSPLNEALANLLNTFEKKIEGFDLGAAMDMAQKFAGMTDEFTVQNAVNAYLESDTHKKNVKEVEKTKKRSSNKTSKSTKEVGKVVDINDKKDKN